ncbi:acyltransferase family protein [Massilia glaciei]|uniref:Acyltransferase n=1 Tax=Massilia glaciei TaxID=1524097 RepID=A0A2U2HMP8_9BURK|nr:acyltransferase family protein [Massilia glaciei]PWF48722.1 acyltransferase [Massilia glaciei]
MNQAGRLHALDNLRAVMMWLGIVLHVAVNHVAQSPLPWRDADTSPVAGLLMISIHAFRMPVFFILAGYFVALLVERRGLGGMVKNRVRRIALPFVIFWPVLLVMMGALVIAFNHLMARGTIGFDPSLLPKHGFGNGTPHTMHMWFLYYLFLFCLLSALIGGAAQRMPAWFKDAFDAAMHGSARSWWGVFVLTAPLALIGAAYPGGMLVLDGSFIPNPPELLHNGLFFVFGWTLHRHQETLLPHYSKQCWWYTAAGGIVFFFSLKLFSMFAVDPGRFPYMDALMAFNYNLAGWLLSFGMIGLFLRYLPRQNRLLRYVSESSYWVFLVHMVGTIGFGVLLYNAALGAPAKMGINIALTTLACLGSYHFFVRNTVVGVLLNGRRHTERAMPAAVPA